MGSANLMHLYFQIENKQVSIIYIWIILEIPVSNSVMIGPCCIFED